MSGRFMKIRKVCISTLTLLILTSQLAGCASATQKEMLNMYNNNQSITIEIAEPISQEQGTEVEFEWKELASLDTYEDFRFTVDDALGITAHGESGKNGVLYVDLDGNQTNNSTMMYAYMNQKFRDNVLNNSDTMKAILDATKDNYVDVESDGVAKVAFFNAYYNIFNDAEPNYFNGYQTLTRAEFLEGAFKACNPVQTLEVNPDLQALVDSTGKDTSVQFASAYEGLNYLTTSDKSLNNGTYNGTISRAEAVYLLVKLFYNVDYNATTGKESAYTDTKNGGDIAKKIGLIQTNKETNETTTKDYLTSYELSYALQNPDGGMPDELYKAMVVAKQHGIITSSESRWDEGLTKGEAISMFMRVFENRETLTNANRGAANGEVVNNENPEVNNTGSETTNNENNENSTTNNENPTENEGDIPKEDINDIGNGVEEGVVDENNIENQTPAESTEQPVAPTEQPAQQSSGKPANIPVEEYPIFREELGLTDEQLATITEEELMELIHEKMIKDRQERMENYKPSSSSGGSGSSSDLPEETHDPSRVPQLDPGDGSLPGHM